MRIRRTAARSWVLTAVLCLALSGCVTPATGSDSYRDKAVTSVRAATSEVATAKLVARLVIRGRILPTYADETVTANESALGSIGDAFGSVQPPRGDDDIRDEVSGLVSDAEDAVGHARIAIRRSDDKGLQEAVDELRKVANDLSSSEKKLS